MLGALALILLLASPASAQCDCCQDGGQVRWQVNDTQSGLCGILRNFRCSNDGNATCIENDDTTCDFGTCLDPPGICSGNFALMCSGNGTPCTGSCGEVVSGNLPLDLDCGGLYFGGGGATIASPQPLVPTTLDFLIQHCASIGCSWPM